MLVEKIPTGTENVDIVREGGISSRIRLGQAAINGTPETQLSDQPFQWYSVADKYVAELKTRHGEDVFSETEVYKIDDAIAQGADVIEANPGITLDKGLLARVLRYAKLLGRDEFSRFFNNKDTFWKLATEQHKLNVAMAADERQRIFDTFCRDFTKGRLPKALFLILNDPEKMGAMIAKSLESGNPNTSLGFDIPDVINRSEALRRWARYKTVTKAAPRISLENRVRISVLNRNRSFYAEVLSYDKNISIARLEAAAGDLGVREIIYRIREIHLERLRIK